MNRALLHLESITKLLYTSFPILILPNIDTLLYKHVEAFSDIHFVFESIVCEYMTFYRFIMYHLKRTFRGVDLKLNLYIYIYK